MAPLLDSGAITIWHGAKIEASGIDLGARTLDVVLKGGHGATAKRRTLQYGLLIGSDDRNIQVRQALADQVIGTARTCIFSQEC